MTAAERLQEAIIAGCTRDDHDHVAEHRAEVLAEAVDLIEATRAADEAAHRDVPAHLNRRVGMREAMAVLRREYEPEAEPSRRPRVQRPAVRGKDTSGAVQASAGESTQQLTARIYDSLITFNQTACWNVLRLAQARQYLAEHLATALADLGRAIEHRDHWHAELMHADARIAELGRKLGAGAAPFVPRTEREHWVAIADALNSAGAAGVTVGIDMEGILTDHLAWAVVWNRETERWEVGGYEDDSPTETPASAEDWVICCSPDPRCPNGERRARAVERGWTQEGRAGNWLCAEHSPGFFQPGHTYTDSQFPQLGWAFRCDTVTQHPVDRERTALGWRRVLSGEWEPYAYGDHDWDPEHFKGVATAPGGESRG